MYGAEHGGAEAVYVLTFGMINNIALANVINAGEVSGLLAGLAGEELAQAQQTLSLLAETESYIFLLGTAERAFAIASHIGLSVLVWFAVKDRRNAYLFWAAVALHAMMDFIATYIASVMPVLAAESSAAASAAAPLIS